VKIYRTTIYRDETLWSTRICTSRRQWAQLKQDFGHIGITRMKLEAAEVPDHFFFPDTELPEPVGQDPFVIDDERRKLGLPPFGLPETSEPIVMTAQGPVPFSKVSEVFEKEEPKKDEAFPGFELTASQLQQLISKFPKP
jgi:hypothetical protein